MPVNLIVGCPIPTNLAPVPDAPNVIAFAKTYGFDEAGTKIT